MSKRKYYLVLLLFLVTTGFLVININPSSNEIHITLAGDILLDRGVRKALANSGYDYPYENIQKIIENADISFANLECPLTAEGTPVLKDRVLIFKGDQENGEALKEAGWDILSLANNHSMDYGPEGLENTLNILRSYGIKKLGAGKNQEEARQPVIFKKGYILVGFLGYSVFPPEGYITNKAKADIARVAFNNISLEVKRAKEKCDFLVVSFHWGREFNFFPSSEQKELAYLAVENGADLIVGHHPHVLQGIENYQGKLIFYSLGNFVFDRQIPKGTDETIIVDITVNKQGWREARIIPVKIEQCQPQQVKGNKAQYILERLNLYSRGLNTRLSVKNDLGYIIKDSR